MARMRKLKGYQPTRFMAETSHYSKAKADFAVNFIENLCHTKGTWSGKKFELIDWQEQIIRDLFGTVKKTGYRQFTTAYIEIAKKQGKQLALDTLLPTPDGFTTMGKVQVGDALLDEHGQVCHVVAKSAVDHEEQAYRITFRDGEVIVAGARHQWKGELLADAGSEVVLTTEEIFSLPKENNGFPFRIPITPELRLKLGTGRTHFLIENIKPVENPGMQCVQVDSPSHLYLAGRSFVPTHNSELAAAVALLLTCADGEQRAEVYGCAADRQQATIVFDVAADMVRMCPALSKRVKILASQKRLLYVPTNSFYQVLSAEAYSKHGFNISGVVFDELHTQPDRKLYDVMTMGSGDARTQPLYFLITTAGNNTNSICYEVHQKAKDILAGRKIDPTFYPVIYGAEETDDWTDPEVWAKANPSLGITVSLEKVQAACDSARQNPGEENAFRQLRLNQWVKQNVRWMPMEKWDACDFEVDPRQLEGRVCYGGLDLSSTSDITAFVLVFPPTDEDDKYYVMPFFWLPEETLDIRVRRDHVPYDVWNRQGLFDLTEGNVVHYARIEKAIGILGERYNIREIAFDRWGAVQMVQNLEGMGFTVFPFGQGFRDMSPPTKELMKLVLEKRIAHGGNPVLRWMMDNIYIKQDPAGNIKADKEKSTEKIDGVIATIMALDRAIRGGNVNAASVYDNRGILFL